MQLGDTKQRQFPNATTKIGEQNGHDFVEITDNGTDSFVAVDTDGGADNFVQILKLESVTGLTDEAALVTNGNLIAA